MWSPRGQAVLEAKILSSASASKICPWPRTRSRAFVLSLSSNFLFWPRENVCNAGIGNFEFLTHNYQFHYVFKFAFMVVFNCLWVIPDCRQQWNIRSDSHIFSPGQACAWLSSSATTLFSGILCASKFCPCWENFLAQWHMSARRAHMSNAVLETLVFLKCSSHL